MILLPLWAVWSVLILLFGFTGWLTWTLQRERSDAAATITYLSMTLLKQSEKIRELNKDVEQARKDAKNA